MTTLLRFDGIERVSSGFLEALIALAQSLRLDPNGLAAVMSRESGFNPQAVNPHSGATGLIQFMPSTAKQLGTTVEALRGMTDIEQLEYVRRFYAPFAGKLKTRGDYYMATFMPAFVGRDPSTVLEMRLSGRLVPFVRGEKPYEQNAGLDLDGDGRITVGDVNEAIERTWRKAGARPAVPLVEEAEAASALPSPWEPVFSPSRSHEKGNDHER